MREVPRQREGGVTPFVYLAQVALLLERERARALGVTQRVMGKEEPRSRIRRFEWVSNLG